MNSPATNPEITPRIWRVAALLAAGLVLLLSVASVSPALHNWLHDLGHNEHTAHACSHDATDSAAPDSSHAPESENHACAVTLLANGHAWIALFSTLLLFWSTAISTVSVFPEHLLTLASVDHAWPHSCGPPMA